ncbi:MAG: transglycosylase family protein [Acidimicrobiales bacterium]
MKRWLLSIALIATTFLLGGCTADEMVFFDKVTAPTREALNYDQLNRLRMCESTDNYQAVSWGGLYRGGYQFDYRTWNDVASRHFPWLMGLDPAAAEPYWQDAMARALFTERGRQPWPVCGRRI